MGFTRGLKEVINEMSLERFLAHWNCYVHIRYYLYFQWKISLVQFHLHLFKFHFY